MGEATDVDLSEHEKRELAGIEQRLTESDPGLVASLRRRRRATPNGRLTLAVLRLGTGVVLMAAGIARAHLGGIVMAEVGFLVLLGSVIAGAGLLHNAPDTRPSGSRSDPEATGPS